jgi:hypothetical protein
LLLPGNPAIFPNAGQHQGRAEPHGYRAWEKLKVKTEPRRMRRSGAQRSGELQRRIGRADQFGGATKLF